MANKPTGRLRPIVAVALNTRTKRFEILNLKCEDVDFSQKHITGETRDASHILSRLQSVAGGAPRNQNRKCHI
jgi:hypothetical protein